MTKHYVPAGQPGPVCGARRYTLAEVTSVRSHTTCHDCLSHAEPTGMDVETASTDALHAAVRRAGWKPARMRQQVADLGDALPAEAAAAVLAAAAVIEADGPRADAELARRRAALPPFRGYVR